MLAFLHVDVHAAWKRIFLGGLSVFAFDVNLAQALADFAVAHNSVDFADDGRILRLARFEEFDDARQTAGDVLGLGGFPRNLRKNVARLHIVAVLNHQVGARRHQVLFLDLARVVADQDGRLVLFIARRQCHNVLRQTGNFVHLLFDGQAGAQIVEFHRTARFRQNRERERIPFRQCLAVGHAFAFGHAQTCAIYNVIAFFFAALFVNDGDQAGTVHGNGSAAAALNIFEVHELHDTVVANFERGALAHARRGSANVERTHRKLRAGFADGLRGNHTNRFAEFHHAARCKVAAVAQRANTAARFAGKHRANSDSFDARGLHGIG